MPERPLSERLVASGWKRAEVAEIERLEAENARLREVARAARAALADGDPVAWDGLDQALDALDALGREAAR